MNITKYMHSCLVVEKDGQRLVVDPGVWTEDFVVPENVAGVVVTHEHSDHLDTEKLRAIVTASPDAIIYAHEAVLAKIEGLKTQAVAGGETVSVGNFLLRFTGGEHAIIHESWPTFANLGVMIDDTLYYPGDSFALPDAAVQILALPAAAPWMVTAEAMDFLATIKPKYAFPTHDAILSTIGQGLADSMLGQVAEQIGTHYERFELGKATEL